MTIEYDKLSDAAYMRFSREKVSKSVPVSDHLIADLDAEGNTVGLELLQVSSNNDMADLLKDSAEHGIPVIVN